MRITMSSKIAVTLAMLTYLLAFAITPILAADEVGNLITNQLDPIGTVYGGQNGDPNSLSKAIAEIIKVVLGFLGVIFIVLILYAGFMWMTSAGNEEKISKAKKTMVAAIIGTAIVLAAYAITFFVIDQLLVATGGDRLN
jgi:preprotein translocase subunit SecG